MTVGFDPPLVRPPTCAWLGETGMESKMMEKSSKTMEKIEKLREWTDKLNRTDWSSRRGV